MVPSEQDISAIAAGFLRYSKSLREDDSADAVWSPETDPDCRDYEFVQRHIRSGPVDVAWRVVGAILSAADDDELATQAAGPLEDLVRLHGAELVESIEKEATRDERFRWALGQIWLDQDELPLEALERIVKASGNAIHPFPSGTSKASTFEPPPNDR